MSTTGLKSLPIIISLHSKSDKYTNKFQKNSGLLSFGFKCSQASGTFLQFLDVSSTQPPINDTVVNCLNQQIMPSRLENILFFSSSHHTTKDNKHVKLIVQWPLTNV